MTMGIEHFRTLVLDKSGLDDRRVTIGDDNGRQTIEAPKSFQGRVVAWIKTKIFGELPTEGVIRANQTARGVFYDALVKSHGKEIADKALRKVYGYEVGSEEGLQFRGRTTTLQGSTVKRLLEVADKYRGEHQLSTAKKVVKFVKDGNLFEAMQAVNLTVGHPGITGREEGLRRKFDELVRMHPDFARREFTDNDMIDIAYKACSQYIDDLKQNFDDRFPELAKLDNGIVHDARSYFQQLRDSLQGTLNRLRLTEPDEAKWIEDALTTIEQTAEQLSETPFDRQQARQLSEQLLTQANRIIQKLGMDAPLLSLRIEQRQKVLEAMEQAINRQFPNLSEGDKTRLTNALTAHIENWIDTHHDDLVGQEEDEIAARTELCRSLGDLVANNLPEGVNDDGSFAKSFAGALESRLGELQGLRETCIALETELRHQASLLYAKGISLQQYSECDPLSDKALVFEEMVMAKASLLALQEIEISLRHKLENLEEPHDDDPSIGEDIVIDEDTVEERRQKIEADLAILGTLVDEAKRRLKGAEDRYEKASTERGTTSIEDRRIGFKNTWHTPRVQLMRFLQRSQTQPTPPEKVGRLVERLLVEYRTKALETLPQWQTVSRLVVANRDGVTNVYSSKITPHGQIGGAVGQPFPQGENEEGGEGLVPSQTYHPPNLQVSELTRIDDRYDEETNKVTKETTNMTRIIRHGVVDSWKIGSPEERARVSKENAREVLTVAVQVDEPFRTRAVQRLVTPERDNEGNPKRNKIIHININLESTDPSSRGGSRDEVEFTRHQFTAFESLSRNGQVELLVDTDVELDDVDDSIQTGSGLSHNLEIDVENDGNLDIVGSEDDLKLEDVNFFDEDSGDKNVQNEQQPKLVDETEQPLKPIEKVTFDLETITFAFGVNDRSRHRQYYDHNRENLIKLYGDLKPLSAPGGVIGGLVTQLKDLANDRRTDPEDVEAANELIGMIQREVDTARTMFENGNYARPGNDPYKMIRTVMRIVNLGTEALELLGDDTTLMSLSEGCREYLDGGSVADAEHKTQVISEDMGGRVLVGQRLDPQDQIIYQSVLTGGGQTEMSQMYGGQLGGRHYNELRRRIGDQDVVDRLTGKTKPDPEIEGLEDNPGNNNNLIIEIGGGNNRDSISNDD